MCDVLVGGGYTQCVNAFLSFLPPGQVTKGGSKWCVYCVCRGGGVCVCNGVCFFNSPVPLLKT